jgi:hypothetical protein
MLECSSTLSAVPSSPTNALAGTVARREAPDFELRLQTARHIAAAAVEMQAIIGAERRYQSPKEPLVSSC